MSVNFKALGGLLTFRYINEVEDLDLDDLQDIVNDLEEEYSVINKDRKELRGEINKIREVIDKKNPEEKREKIKNKQKSAKDILGDEDIPYEVRMKYIIDAYRKDQKKWGKLYEYAKHLEDEVIRLKNILIINGYADPGVIDDVKPAQVITELREENKELKQKLNIMQQAVNDPDGIIKLLEERITKTYPKRVHKMSSYKKVIKSQEDYIKALQKLLDENGIKYHEKCPINDIEANGADAIDENAVRD